MSTGYQVIGPYVNGEVISATLFNNDFGAIAAAMHQTTGHDHDGTTGGGAPIAKIGDADFNNKIEIDGNFIKFSIEINGNTSQQVLHISADGLYPSISGIDLGAVATPFDTANITTVNAGTVNASTEILVGHATNSTAETGSGASLTPSGVAYFTKDNTADDAAVVITRVDSSNGGDEWLEFQKYISSTDSHQTLGSIKQYANSGISISTPSSLLLNATGSLYLNAGGSTNNDIVFDGSYFRPVSQADGNVGLGSSSQKFSDLYLSGDIILKDDETDVSSQKIRFENDTNRYAEISSDYSSDADGKGTGLIFTTTADANDNGTPKERLKITEGGDIIIRQDDGNTGIFWDASLEKLGVGTIHPDGKLHVAGGSSTMAHYGSGNKHLLDLRNDFVPPNENTSASSVTMRFLASDNLVGSIIATGSKSNSSSTREFNFKANSAPISFNYNSSVISSIDGYGLKVSNTLSSGSIDTSIEGAILTPSGQAYLTTDSSSTTSMMYFKRLTNVDDGRFLELRTGASYIGSLQQGTSEVDSSRKSLNINSNTLGLRSANEISFFTDGATDERMRIEQDGNVVVYTTLEAVGNIVSRQPLAVTPSAPNASDVPTFILGNYNGYSSSSSTNAKIVKYNDGLSSHSVPNAYPLELIGSLGGVYDGVITLSPLSTAISNDLGPQHQITFLTESNYVGGVVTGYEDARIGIGEEFPKNHLVVKGSSNSTVEINASSDAIGEIIFTNPTNTDEGSIQYYNDTEKMYFSTANTQRIAIDADGQLGIGELSPSEALDVVGNIAVSGTVDGVDIDALNTTVSGKADLSGDTFTGLIEADGGLLIPETSRLEIGDNDFGGNNTFLSVDSNGVTAFYSYNNVVFQSAANLQLSGTGNSPLLKGNRDGSGNYEVSLHYGTGQERLITTSDGINITGDITLTGTVDGIDIDALNTTVSGKADLSGADFTGDVTTTGAVGIGTDDPDYTLQIEVEPTLNNPGPQQYYDPMLHLKATGTETQSILRMTTPALGRSKIQFGDNIDDDVGQIEYRHSNNTMWFTASNNSVMKLQNSEVDVFGTLDVSGTVEAEDVIVYETQAAAVSPLLTTDRTAEELADLYYLVTRTIVGLPPTIEDYQERLINFSISGLSENAITTADNTAITTFINDSNNNYTATEQSDYSTYIAASPYVYQSTIVQDIQRGDYDYLIAPAKVGINTESPASALDVIGDISVSGNITSDLGLNLTPTQGIEMRAGDADGIEMHWWAQSSGTTVAADGEQTKRFHITDRGVHVGDDVTGTYTAGDSQTNQDIDFGFLVGRNSENFGSNNVGIGYDLAFPVNSASNFAQGSIIDFYGATQNCAAFGGNLDVGQVTNTLGLEHSFIGGHIARTNANETFTWATGVVTPNGQHYSATNNGQGSVLFGKQGDIDADSTYSLLGGRVGPGPDFIEPSLINSSYAFSWGQGNVVEDSNASVVCGDLNSVDGAANALVVGESNTVLSSNAFVAGSGNETTAVDAATAIGKDNTAEGNYSVAIGKDNISLGEAGVCLGQNLKTSIFNQSVTNQPSGPYQWDNYTTVVGGYNNPSYKYLTDHTGSTTWVDNHRFVVGTGTSEFTTDNGFIVAVPDAGNGSTTGFCGILMPHLAESPSYSSTTAAKNGGVPIGGLYRDGNDIKILLSTD